MIVRSRQLHAGIRRFWLLVALSLLMPACGDSDPQPVEKPIETSAPQSAPGADESSLLSSLDDLPPGIETLLQPWTGDLDGMTERRLIRLLTVHNPMIYSLDGAKQRGIVYEAATEFEKNLNQKLRRRRLQVHLVIVPVRRDQLIPALIEGRGDIVAANLTITPERAERVDFTEPLLRDVQEIVVTGPSTPELRSLDDLSGLQLRLRRSSSYWSSVERLNESLAGRGLPPVRLFPANPYLEDHDLLEMVNAGMLSCTIVDSHKSEFWSRIMDRITPRHDLAVRQAGEIAWAFRKNSPQLRDELNAFVRKHRKGTLFGNVVYQRYLQETDWVHNALDDAGRERLNEMGQLFRKYGEQYGFDWLMLVAQGYQESGLDQRRRSRAGAVGVMQLMPPTARHVGIADVSKLEDNIHAGAKYMRYLIDHYFDEEDLSADERHLFALAAYNAGPTRIKGLRRQAEANGFDPDLWFNNVEVLVARKVGGEPVRYVSNITKYYLAYRMLADQSSRAAPSASP